MMEVVLILLYILKSRLYPSSPQVTQLDHVTVELYSTALIIDLILRLQICYDVTA